MTEVRRKITDACAHLGTMIDAQGAVMVAGAALETVKKIGPQNILMSEIPIEFYATRDDARKDGWV